MFVFFQTVLCEDVSIRLSHDSTQNLDYIFEVFVIWKVNWGHSFDRWDLNVLLFTHLWIGKEAD